MYAKRLKRKCMVRGCKNVDTYSISHTREGGNSVIICLDCLSKALTVVNDYKEIPNVLKKSVAPSLFFNTGVKVINENICSKCNRKFSSEKGLKTHLRTCKGEDLNEN
jgi:hypothetical protein